MRNIIKLGGFIITISIACSCSDIKFGDDFLGTAPELNETTLDSMFSSKLYAEKVLTQAYTYLPYGLPTGSGATVNKLGLNILESLTDLNSSYRDNASDGPGKLYYSGTLSSNHNAAGNEAYRYGAEYDWNAIRYAWIYIENVQRVPDMSEQEKAERIAEAKMIIALSYAEMLRYVGGFPYIDHAVEPTEEMNFPRLTFAESVQKIVNLIDEAIPSLEWIQNKDNDGRMNKAGAYGLKLRVQLFAASPTFNSDTKWHPEANEYTCYGNYDKARWEEARKTAETFLTALESIKYYKLIQPISNSHSDRRAAFRQAYYNRGGTEVLISTRRGADHSIHSAFMEPSIYWGPTLNYVNMFPWENGDDFEEDFDWEHPSRQPFFDGATPTRDPRLYETVAVPGDIYRDGTLAPVYKNCPNGFQKRGTGFRMMKFILQQAADRTQYRPQWPYLRLAEVYLSYAEILNHLDGPTTQAYNYVKKVRERVGLSGLPGKMSREQFLEAVLRERALEFGYEEVRWFDLIRYGRKDDFTKKLYGLESEGDKDINPTSYTFKKIELSGVHQRFWATHWDTKWYLAPIPLTEINKEYGMTQNPGW